jgi:hypothetical protein
MRCTVNVFFIPLWLIRNVSSTEAFTGSGDIRRTVAQEEYPHYEP